MRALIASLLGAALPFVACSLEWPVQTEQRTKDDAACDANRFGPAQNVCDSTFKSQVPLNRLDNDELTCSVYGNYKLCLVDLIQATRCDDGQFLAKQLQPMQKYIRENRIECTSKETTSWTRPPATLASCAEREVWETHFVCAKSYYSQLHNIEGPKQVGTRNESCRLLTRYQSCVYNALRSGSCSGDPDLLTPTRYFTNVLTRRHRDMCFPGTAGTAWVNVSRLPETKVLRLMAAASVESSDMQSCDQEVATKKFFGCGLLFNVIVSQNPDKEKLCIAYRNLEQCTRDLQCPGPADFNKHSVHVMNVLLSQYDHYCRGFVPQTRSAIIRPTGPTTPPPCNENAYMEKFFECGLKFLFNLRDALYGAGEEYKTHVCGIIRNHKACTGVILQNANCPKVPCDQASLNYIDKSLWEGHDQHCSTKQRHRGKRKFRTSLQHCHLREYAGSYFTCGTIFLRNTYPDRPATGEDCRFYRDFMKCLSLLIACRSPGDIEPSLNYFTEVLTAGYDQKCAGIKESVSCDKMFLLKNYYYCGMGYYQAYNEFGSSYLLNEQHACKLLDDYQDCLHKNVLSNSCPELSVLFTHFRVVRDCIVTMFNNKHRLSCSIRPGKLKRRSYLRMERQSSCDEFKAVKKLVFCGATFYRMVTVAENASSHQESNRSRVCPLVKQMQRCVRSAGLDSGCYDSTLLSPEVYTLEKRLLLEFKDECGALTPESPSDFGQPRPEVCQLKEFNEEWESCDSTAKDDIRRFVQNKSGNTEITPIHSAQRSLCKRLAGHRECLETSADKQHCSALVPRISDLTSELFDRTRLVYCSRAAHSRMRAPSIIMPLAIVTVVRALRLYTLPE